MDEQSQIQQDISELIHHLEKHHIEAEDLDELIYELYMDLASNTNNAGLEEQVDTLVKIFNFTPTEIISWLGTIPLFDE